MPKMVYFVRRISPLGVLLQGAIEARLDVETVALFYDLVFNDDPELCITQQPDVIIAIDEEDDSIDGLLDQYEAFGQVLKSLRLRFPSTPLIAVSADCNIEYCYLEAIGNIKRINADIGSNTNIGAFETLCRAIKKAIG